MKGVELPQPMVSQEDNRDKENELLTARKANALYGVRPSTLWSWVRKGYLKVAGRLRGNAPGGGLTVFKKQDILRLIENPPPRGRPSKAKGTGWEVTQ